MDHSRKTGIKIVAACLMASALLTACGGDRELTPEERKAANLPPDPGEAVNKTLAGIDSDNDGIRDDIQILIYKRHSSDARARHATRKMAKAMQQAILAGDQGDDVKMKTVAEEASVAMGCLFEFVQAPQEDIAFLEFETVNTDERKTAFTAFNEATRGEGFQSADAGKGVDLKDCK